MKKVVIKKTDGRTLNVLCADDVTVDFYIETVEIAFTNSEDVKVQLSIPRNKEFVIEIEV